MMRIICLLSLCALVYTYTDIMDKVNIENMMKNATETKIYLDCYLDKIPCPPIAVPYRKHLTEMVSDACRECNDKQRHIAKIFLKTIKNEFPEDYAKFKGKYDMDSEHFKVFESEVDKY